MGLAPSGCVPGLFDHIGTNGIGLVLGEAITQIPLGQECWRYPEDRGVYKYLRTNY